MKVFVINIGNTNTEYGVFENGQINEVTSCPTISFERSMIPSCIPVAFASVVPSKNSIFDGLDSFRLSAQSKTGLDFSNVDSSTIGADRVANAVATAFTEKLPAVCIDCGTAITFEIVSSSRAFLGGAILPGRTLQRKALRDHTAQLPLVPLSSSLDGVFAGTSTADAIRLGVDAGTVGAVKEILVRVRNFFPVGELTLIATGGDAEFFKREISELEIRDNKYTLYGIAKAWEMNKSEN
ncbi:MAG: hypothetical protein A2020_10690 [Lentisphaerae bacterium GWF2_45_14]|nr:MAG: hypothetical protein A2020_10690 [Lentisphaerae bacterium GWF2_45_14]